MKFILAKSTLEKIIDWLLLLVIIIFPIAVNIVMVSPKDLLHPIISINFSIADLLIGLAFVIWFIKIIVFKEINYIKLPPLPIMLFIIIGLISVINAVSIKDWLKDIIKFIEYFFIFYILLLNNFQEISIKKLKNILFISAGIIVIIALIQHVLLNGSPYLIRGVFENRIIFGSYLCIIIPLIYSDLLYAKNIYRKIWLSFIILGSLFVITSGSALLSIITGLLLMSLLHSIRVLFRYLITVIVIIILSLFFIPQKNIKEVENFCNIYEQGKISENYYRRLTILNDLEKTPLLNKKVGTNSLIITNDLFMPSTLPKLRTGNRYKDMDNTKHVKQIYVEMEAALSLLAKNTLLGVGLGNYQQNISIYYGDLHKINTTEPNQLNGFLAIAVTTGILGLSLFLWIVFYSIKSNYVRFKEASVKFQCHELSLGLIGSIVACMIENCFSFLLVTGIFVPFILVIYLSAKEKFCHE